MLIKSLFISASIVTLAACAELDSDTISSTSLQTNVPLEDSDGTSVTGSFAKDANSTQILAGPGGSDIDGTALQVAPGALAIDTSITMAEGEDRSDEAIDELDLDGASVVHGAGATSLSSPSGDAAISGALVLSIQIPVSANDGSSKGQTLALADGTSKLVMLSIYRNDSGDWVFALKPVTSSDVSGLYVNHEIGAFGWFRLVYLSKAVAEKTIIVKAAG